MVLMNLFDGRGAAVEEGEGEVNAEGSMEAYTLPYVK